MTKSFVAAGAFVTIGDFNQENGKRVAKLFSSDQVTFVPTNVTVWEDQVRLFKTALTQSPSKSLDIVVSNAGISRKDPVWWDGKLHTVQFLYGIPREIGRLAKSELNICVQKASSMANQLSRISRSWRLTSTDVYIPLSLPFTIWLGSREIQTRIDAWFWWVALPHTVSSQVRRCMGPQNTVFGESCKACGGQSTKKTCASICLLHGRLLIRLVLHEF